MDQLNKNYVKYVSSLILYWENSKKENTFLTKNYSKKIKSPSKTSWISTCLLRGRLKKVYKNNKISRHSIRDESKKKFLKVWSIRTW